MTTITIIRTSDRGAHLVTDGNKVAWVQGRWCRVNGTLTPRGIEALADGQTVEEFEAQKRAREEARQQAFEARQQAFEEGKKLITVLVPANTIVSYSERAWKIFNGSSYRNRYGKVCRDAFFAPKSQITVEILENGKVEVTMPKWYFSGEWTNQGMRVDGIELALVAKARR